MQTPTCALVSALASALASAPVSAPVSKPTPLERASRCTWEPQVQILFCRRSARGGRWHWGTRCLARRSSTASCAPSSPTPTTRPSARSTTERRA
eukprot:5530974-Pleurochrysis_carterae.AAC.2